MSRTAKKSGGQKPASVDPREIAQFSAMAETWWDPKGPFRPLHKLNPTRLSYIRKTLEAHFGRGATAKPCAGLKVLDIGCGGGLLAEPMARLGASVTGIDASAKNIKIAGLHARTAGLKIDYRAITGEELAKTGARFDVILNMEVIEHVADVASFLAACRALLKPGGIMLFSTINRTPKAFLFAIVGAEYVLRWLPTGTHHYEKFIKPSELDRALKDAGFALSDLAGLVLNPLRDAWDIRDDLSVNYIGAALPV